jgi:hypothetical protein
MLNINKAIEKKKRRKHEYLFWAIDIHDTIFPSTYSNSNLDRLGFYNKNEIKFLQFLSENKECMLILYTSTHDKDIKPYLDLLAAVGIYPDFVNENPLCPSTELADFSKKFYFDILIDDKAGFDPDSDWNKLAALIPWLKKELNA